MNTPFSHEKSTAADFFLYLLATITLYLCMWRFIELWFEYIRYLFPDELGPYSYSYTGDMRFSVALLIIVFPVYLGITRYLRRDMIKNPEKKELRVRKWLVNLTLFVTALTIIIDLITLLNRFLEGELTVRFVLQTLIVLIVAAAVFAYYFWDMRSEMSGSEKMPRMVGLAVSIILVASIVGGFFIIGSPQTQRLRRLDDRRVMDLQTIQGQILQQWSQKGVLPATLDGLKDDISGFVSPVDPQTKEPYGYKVLSKESFEICAVFALASGMHSEKQYAVPSISMYQPFNVQWDHDKGSYCFTRKIDPQAYPPNDANAPAYTYPKPVMVR